MSTRFLRDYPCARRAALGPVQATSARRLATGLVLGLWWSAWGACASAGVMWEMTDTDLSVAGQVPVVTRLHAQGGNVRQQSGGADSPFGIFRGLTSYNVDPRSHSYMKTDQESVARASVALRAANDEFLARIQPELRAEMRRLSAAPQMRETGRRELAAASYPCRVWEAFRDDVKEGEFCIVAPADIPGGDELMRAANTLHEQSEQMRAAIGDVGMAGAAALGWRAILSLGGYPVIQRKFSDGKVVHETALTAIREAEIPAEMFDVPAGYQRVGRGPPWD